MCLLIYFIIFGAVIITLFLAMTYCNHSKTHITSNENEKIETKQVNQSNQSSPLLQEKIYKNVDCFDLFCNYVKHNRVTNIEEVALKFKTSKEEAIKQIRESEKINDTMGFINNNEYFYLTSKELELLNKLTSKKNDKTYTKTEIDEEFKKILKGS